MSAGRSLDPAHAFITIEVETYTADGKKMRKQSSCDLCGARKVFSNIGRWNKHFTGDAAFCVDNGGLGQCLNVPAESAMKFKKKVCRGVLTCL